MAKQDPYRACLERMYALRRFGIKLGLDTIKTLLDGLHNPHEGIACIHVAGTNGKGSIASTLSSILHASGLTVGLYTSPHLVCFNERICIDHRPISDGDVVTAYEAVNRVRHGSREPTFFEYTTAMALYVFGRKNVDWAIIETGMGGRLDATNIINPVCCIISNVSIEHQMYLGNTIAEIAREKGGIIKKHTPVISGVKQKNAIRVLDEIATKRHAPLYRLGNSFRVKRNNDGTFNYYGIEQVWRNLQSALAGRHQVDNAALALATCELLIRMKMADIPLESITTGLAQNNWPGRLEIVSTEPLVILDGAHNRIAAQNLAAYLDENLKHRPVTLIVGILDDKPYAAMLRSLLPHCRRVIITRPKIDRGLAPEILYSIAKDIISDITVLPTVDAAVRYALETASPNDAVCIAGSLYVVGEAKETLATETPAVE